MTSNIHALAEMLAAVRLSGGQYVWGRKDGKTILRLQTAAGGGLEWQVEGRHIDALDLPLPDPPEEGWERLPARPEKMLGDDAPWREELYGAAQRLADAGYRVEVSAGRLCGFIRTDGRRPPWSEVRSVADGE